MKCLAGQKTIGGVWTEECQSLGLKRSVNGTVYSTSPAYIGLLTNN